MDPRNPNVIEARTANSEYIVYYSQVAKTNQWDMERVSNKEIVACGSLEAMLSLIPLFPNSRRATWAEDMSRYKPFYLTHYAFGFSPIDDDLDRYIKVEKSMDREYK